jgi:hypothetical protein
MAHRVDLANEVVRFTMDYDQFVAVGSLERMDARLLTPSFENLWPLDKSSRFDALIAAIDEADRRLKQPQRHPPH